MMSPSAKRRVLWFTSTPAAVTTKISSRYTNTVTWVRPLESKLLERGCVDLCVAFPMATSALHTFQEAGATYIGMPTFAPDGKLGKWKDRLTHRIAPTPGELNAYEETVRAFNPDIIHVFGAEHPFGLVASRVRVPMVVHFQGNIAVYSRKFFSGIPMAEVLRHSRVRELLRGAGVFHDYFRYRKVARREAEIFRLCKYVMGRTDWDRRVTSVLAPHARYYHCDEVMRSEFLESQWSPKQRDTLVIASTMRDSSYKGLETIYDAMGLLKECGVACEWRVSGVGPGDSFVDVLRRMAGRAGLDPQVILLGGTDAAGILRELLNADIYVHPSHIENSPNSVCEAMLLGMPVIATNTGGTPSLLDDRSEGLLVQDGDPYALAGAVMELARNPAMAKELGQHARQTARTRHDPDRVVDALLAVYDDILGREGHD